MRSYWTNRKHKVAIKSSIAIQSCNVVLPVHLMTSTHLWGRGWCPSSSLSVWALCAGLASLLFVLLLAVSAVSSFIWMRSTASISASGVVNGTPVCSILRRTASLIRDASNPTCKATWEHNQMVQYSNSWIIPSNSTLNFNTGKLLLIFLWPSKFINTNTAFYMFWSSFTIFTHWSTQFKTKVDLCYNNCALCEISQTVQLSQDWIITEFLFLKYLLYCSYNFCHTLSRIVKIFSSIFYADCFVRLFKYLVSLVHLYLCMYSGHWKHQGVGLVTVSCFQYLWGCTSSEVITLVCTRICNIDYLAFVIHHQFVLHTLLPELCWYLYPSHLGIQLPDSSIRKW